MMKIRVERLINKSPEAVFETITDHENYKNLPGFKESKLLRTGKTEKNGVGARRYLNTGLGSVEEDITSFEKPSQMNYHVAVMNPSMPLRHTKGEITLTPHDGKTKVVWISEGHIEIPIIGRVFEKLSARAGTRLFGRILKFIDEN